MLAVMHEEMDHPVMGFKRKLWPDREKVPQLPYLVSYLHIFSNASCDGVQAQAVARQAQGTHGQLPCLNAALSLLTVKSRACCLW
jgi:hypothetical protein